MRMSDCSSDVCSSDLPVEAALTQPGGGKAITAMFGDEFADADLVGLGRRGGEGERDLAEAQFEQPVSAARLAIIVSLRGRPAQYLDLPVVEAEALIDPRDLRLGGALVGKEYPRREIGRAHV